MTSIIPELDDTTFDRMVEDGRGLIPRYAPEWTDHNLHDPGITLIDLLAWMTEQQIYRIGFVGDSLRAAFTRLMAIAPRGPRPAYMLVWPIGSLPVRDFQAGTELRSPDAVEARYLLSNAVRTVAPGIAGLFVWKDGLRKPLGNGLPEGRDPLDLLPATGGGPQMLELQLDGPILALDGAGPASLGVQIAGPGPGEQEVTWTPVAMEQWDPGGFWRVLESEDTTEGLRQSGVILFWPDPASDADRFRLRLDQGFRPGSIRITRLSLNVLPAEEGWSDPGGEIGRGTGLPDQQVEIETDDIVDRSDNLVIETNIGGVETTWEPRADLIGSDPREAHYRLTGDGIAFGNGLNGRIVPLGAQIRVGAVRRTAGAEGAVTAGLDWTIAGESAGRNIAASTPGRNRDRLPDLIARARQASRRRDHALETGAVRCTLMESGLGLADVQVTARRRPGLDGAEAPGSRTVLILPLRDPATRPGAPHPRLRDEVEAVLAPLRLLGERLYVSPPVYVGVDLVVTLVADPDADTEALRTEAEAVLAARLWDLRRRADVAQWRAGRDVTVGEIEGLMAGLHRVVRVPDCRIAPAGRVPGRADIVLGDREIAMAQNISVAVLRDGAPGSDVLPVWIDVAATVIVRPGTDRRALAASAEDALRRWSQTAGSVTVNALSAALQDLPGVIRVAAAMIALPGDDLGPGPIALNPQERARAGAVDIRVFYPSEWEET